MSSPVFHYPPESPTLFMNSHDDDFREITMNELNDLMDTVTEPYPDGQSPSTWTSAQGILTPTSSLPYETRYDRANSNDAFFPENQHIPSHEEVLGPLTAVSPAISMATTFDISDDETAQDVSRDALYPQMPTTQLQQSHQNSNDQLASNFFHRSGPGVNAIDHSFPNAMENGMGMQPVWNNQLSTLETRNLAGMYQAAGHMWIPTQMAASQYSATLYPTLVGGYMVNSATDGLQVAGPQAYMSDQRADLPWDPLNLSSAVEPRQERRVASESRPGHDSARSPKKRLTLRTLGTKTTSRAMDPASPPSVRPRNPGGRTGPLIKHKRAAAKNMRNEVSCWVCALRREACTPGQMCSRCILMSQRNQAHHLVCDRRHLLELVSSFLPEKMNPLKQLDRLHAFVDRNMGTRLENRILVKLTVGCGESLPLWLWEFQPTKEEFRYTSAYVADEDGNWHRKLKRSPPLLFEASSQAAAKGRLQDFVENMVSNDIVDFQDMTCVGEDTFLADLLTLLCELYLGLGTEKQNIDLRKDVHRVLKMIVLTHIIGHAITIEKDAQDSVISRLVRDNDPSLYQEWTSPRMANIQLKQIFSEIRDEIMRSTLNRLHQIFRAAKDKNRTWLSSFVIMLGIAMVSEDYQHLLYIQADHYISQNEKTEHDAKWDAREGCTQIDEGFEFLEKLFHSKYRPKHQTKAKFTEWHMKAFHQAEATFIHRLEDLAQFRAQYLLDRKDLQITSMAEGNHTARLTSRFLTGFMDLVASP